MGTTIVIIISVVIVVSVFAMLITLRMNVAQAAKRDRIERKNQQASRWASAVVKNIQIDGAENSQNGVRAMLTLEITPPEGAGYQTSTVWLVDADALHLLTPGSYVPVKLEAAGLKNVSPAVPWAVCADREKAAQTSPGNP